jgi:hypothetical protein
LENQENCLKLHQPNHQLKNLNPQAMKSFLPNPGKNHSFMSIWMVSFIFLIGISSSLKAQVAINTTGDVPHSSAMLDVSGAGKGILVPRMLLAQRPVSPATGLLIYQTDGTAGYYYYDGTTWQRVGSSANDYWQPSGSNIYFNSGRVGIGLVNPDNNGLNVTNYVGGKAAVKGNDESGFIYATGMLGVLEPYILGVPTTIYNAGVLGIKPNAGANGAAILGWNNDDNTENYSGLFYTDGIGSITNYALYAEAKGGSTNYAAKMRGRMMVEGHNGTTGGADSLSTVLTALVTHSRSSDNIAVYGSSTPQPGYGYGVYGIGGWRGVYGFASGSGYSGQVYGVSGSAASGTGGTAIGIYGYAYGGDINWAGYFSGDCYISSDLRIGTTTQATGYSLSVNGKIACTEVLVQAEASWPDYVFADDYKLMSLTDLENNINKNKHLPGLPAAAEVEKNGIEIGDLQVKLLEKVEELTLHLIEQNKQIEALQQEIKSLKEENSNNHVSK